MTTRVVNVNDYKPYCLYWTNPSPDNPYVYIGRYVRYHIPISSKWRNRFTVKKYGREGAIQMYKEYILNEPELLKLIPTEIKDKTLGCWCRPLPCHGDILADLADSN